MSSSGENRKFIQIFNKYDPCCFSGTEYITYENEIKQIISNLGHGQFEIFLDEWKDRINKKNNLDELNELISLSLKLIRENPTGIDEETLMKKLETSKESFERVCGDALKEIMGKYDDQGGPDEYYDEYYDEYDNYEGNYDEYDNYDDYQGDYGDEFSWWC